MASTESSPRLSRVAHGGGGRQGFGRTSTKAHGTTRRPGRASVPRAPRRRTKLECTPPTEVRDTARLGACSDVDETGGQTHDGKCMAPAAAGGVLPSP